MTCYIYIATPKEWGNNKCGHPNGFKIGYTANLAQRRSRLSYRDGYIIRQAFEFEAPCERVGTTVEHMAQTYFMFNWSDKVKPLGDDYFKASKVNTNKALKQFQAIAERAYMSTLMMANIEGAK